jgi:acyl-CoA thioesterase
MLEVGFESDSRQGAITVSHHLMSPAGGLYGGAALALACTMMEHATQKSTRWCTAQLISPAVLGERIELSTQIIGAGRRTAQLRVRAMSGDREVFNAMGATGVGDPRLNSTFSTMPQVTTADESPPARWEFDMDPDHTYFGLVDFREATVTSTLGADAPTLALWARIANVPKWTAAKRAFVADISSTAIAQAANRSAEGSVTGMSLDNSLRTGPITESEWVLVASYPELVHDGFGQGLARLWAPDGTLVGLATQTFAMRSSDRHLSPDRQASPPAHAAETSANDRRET